MRITHLIYLHGFRSSPRSNKARQMASAVQDLCQQGHQITWACPQLPPSPAQAWRDIQAQVAHWPPSRTAVVGSSLGGFYATALAEHLGCPAVIINPAVAPARDLVRHIGEQTHFHDPQAHFFFKPEFIDEFQAIDPYPITRPERYMALIAKGDEVLDWAEMVQHYPKVHLTLLPGSDHAISDFADHLPAVMAFLGLPAPR